MKKGTRSAPRCTQIKAPLISAGDSHVCPSSEVLGNDTLPSSKSPEAEYLRCAPPCHCLGKCWATIPISVLVSGLFSLISIPSAFPFALPVALHLMPRRTFGEKDSLCFLPDASSGIHASFSHKNQLEELRATLSPSLSMCCSTGVPCSHTDIEELGTAVKTCLF